MSEKFPITLPCHGTIDSAFTPRPDIAEADAKAMLEDFALAVADELDCCWEHEFDAGELGELLVEVDLADAARKSIRDGGITTRTMTDACRAIDRLVEAPFLEALDQEGGEVEALISIGEVREFWIAAHPGATLADWATAVVREAMTAAQHDGVVAQATGLPLDGEADTDSHPDDCQSDEIHIEEDE